MLFIIEQVEWGSLRGLSVVNKYLHDLTNTRLWRQVQIHDWPHPSPTYAQRCQLILATCDAILRDRRRASHVRKLKIVIHFDIAKWRLSNLGIINRLSAAIRNLTRLRVLDMCRVEYGFKELCHNMSSNVRHIPFQLQELVCHNEMYKPLEGFIRSQANIERYVVTNLCYSLIYPPHPPLNPLALLAMKHFCGTPSTTYATIQHRTLESVEVVGRNEGAQLRLTLHPEQIAQNVSATVKSLKISVIWAHEFDCILHKYIECTFGILLSSITRLHIGSHRWPDTQTLPSDSLPAFTSLVNFQWSVVCLEYDGEMTARFTRDCAKQLPSLRRVCFVSAWGDLAIFRRDAWNGDMEAPHHDLSFRDLRGSLWMFYNEPDDLIADY